MKPEKKKKKTQCERERVGLCVCLFVYDCIQDIYRVYVNYALVCECVCLCVHAICMCVIMSEQVLAGHIFFQTLNQ